MKHLFTITGKRLDMLGIDDAKQDKKHIRNKLPE